MSAPEIVRGLTIGAFEREWLLPVEKGNGDEPYSNEPRGCLCDEPIIDRSEPWFITCVRCGAVLS